MNERKAKVTATLVGKVNEDVIVVDGRTYKVTISGDSDIFKIKESELRNRGGWCGYSIEEVATRIMKMGLKYFIFANVTYPEAYSMDINVKDPGTHEKIFLSPFDLDR